MQNKKLSPCPSTPNCVSSLSKDRKHSIDPLKFTGSRDEARKKLLSILQNLKRGRIIHSDNDYIHTEFRSLIFQFVDDVEFLFSEEGSVIHVKSASRTGYSDLGVNRKRVEMIRKAFETR
jgi:uncharacterized protein (DUF1499 family)